MIHPKDNKYGWIPYSEWLREFTNRCEKLPSEIYPKTYYRLLDKKGKYVRLNNHYSSFNSLTELHAYLSHHVMSMPEFKHRDLYNNVGMPMTVDQIIRDLISGGHLRAIRYKCEEIPLEFPDEE